MGEAVERQKRGGKLGVWLALDRRALGIQDRAGLQL